MSPQRVRTTEADRSEATHQIGREGSNVAAARHAATRKRISDAIDEIENIIIKNDGIYPDSSDGKVTKQCVLKKAGLSSAYLEKARPRIKALKAEVEKRLKKIAEVTPGNVDAIRRRVTERAEAARTETRAVRQAYAEAELEHAQTIFDLQQARRTIEELKEQNAALLKQIAGKKVVPIDRGRDK